MAGGNRDRVGQHLGHYRLLRLLGRGGFANVYLGEHVYLKSQAAVKILHMMLKDEDRAVFLQEAQTLVRLSHPHIVRVLDFAVEDETPFLVMEYAPHGTLRQRHPAGTRLSPETIVPYVRQVALALQHAHDQRLIHRDVKPENMLLGSRSEVLLSDFGLAMLAPQTRPYSTHEIAQQVAGTSPYLAPEQLQGKPRPASDQYALGVVVYEWLCGRPPFAGTPIEVAAQHLSMSPPPLREQVPELAPAVEEVVLRALTREPQQRFAQVQDFANALEQACHSGQFPGRSIPTMPEHGQPWKVEASGAATAFPPLWNVPFRRNLFFTGREALLMQIREQLTTERAAALTQSYALSGLGGIGKTQAAVEYAYRYRDAYHAVLWVRAASQETLVADFVSLASLLGLPEMAAPEHRLIVAAVKRWFASHPGWLLIMDNADDLALAADFSPLEGKGHLLLTTRSQATGKLAMSIPVEQMDLDEGSLLLLRRAKQLPPDAPLEAAQTSARTQAQAIVRIMDGLPLALEQAGAYIEETGCGLSPYLELYQQRRSALLRRQSGVSPDYPHTVASTWSLSFGQVEQENPAAAELLRLCAFLAPDSIPEAILTEGASVLGPVLGPVAADPILLNETIQVLRRYSLVKRDPEARLLNLHRLVQAVLKDGMDAAVQRQWAERTVQAVNATFPTVEVATWVRCEQCLPHALICMDLIEQGGFTFPEAGRLLMQVGWYLYERGLYTEAEPLLERARSIRERMLGPEHPEIGETLNGLALLYSQRGRNGEAEPLYQRALSIRERVLGPEHPETCETLNNLALLYWRQSRYDEAESLFQRALSIRERVLGPEHPETAPTLSNLAGLYLEQSRYSEAKPLYQRALSIRERVLGPEHPRTAFTLNGLAGLHLEQGRYGEAEPLYQRALSIRERVLGPEHPHTVLSLNSLAFLYWEQGRYGEAEPLFQRALSICERALGPEHPETSQSLNGLALLYWRQGRYGEAEPLYQRALSIRERVLGPEHPATALTLTTLAILYWEQGRYGEAEPLYQRALSICERVLGPEHPGIALTLTTLALLYRDQGRYGEAEPLFERARSIYERVLGPEHPRTALTLDSLAGLYLEQGRYSEAEPLFQRALSMRERVLGPEHPDIGETLNHLARLYWQQSRYGEAEPLYQRALSMRERVLGPEHPHTVTTREYYARLLQEMKREYAAAPPEPIPPAPERMSTVKPPASSYPDDLTAREVEVLRLVAQGWTDGQIAEQLVISPRTVNAHLTSIYRKIGVSSRSAATRYTMEHGLV